MKKLLMFLLLASTAFAQNRQVDVGNKVFTGDDYNMRATRRGEPQHLTVSKILTWNGDMATTGLSVGSLQKPNGGRAYRVKKLSISSTVLAKVKVIMGSYSFGANPISNGDLIVGPNQGRDIELNETIRYSQQMPSLYVRSVIEASPWRYVAQVTPNTLVVNKSQTTTALNNASNSYTYTLSVTNNTGVATSGTITLIDSLPDGVKVTGASGSGWTTSIGSRGRSITATTNVSIANAATTGPITVTLTPQIMGEYTLTAWGEWVPNDLPASQDVVFVGNSIDNGSGASTPFKGYAQLVTNWLRDTKHLDAELLNLSIPGVNSSDHESLRKDDRRYKLEREPWGIFYHINVNDILSNLTTATSMANLTAILNWKRYNYPNAYLFIVSAAPNGNSTTEAGLVALRTAAQTLTNNLKDNKTFYLPTPGSAWPASSNATKLNPDWTHPTDSGHADLATATINDLTNLNLSYP